MSLEKELDAVLNTDDFLVNSAQFSAFVFENVRDLNWAGFYFYRESELRLGSFQGRVACNPIPLSKGVCGKSARERKTILVDDVHSFEGHIACDERSRSELVIPLVKEDRLLGVFDMDSPKLARFKAEDRELMEKLVEVYISATDFSYLMD
jgi:GAF domain-containing protein